jgi:soluble lytic murein transglycosylase-like protein
VPPGGARSGGILSRVVTGRPAVERISILILVLLSVAFISGKPLTSPAGSVRQVGAEDAAKPLTARDVEVILRSVNPILDPRSQRRIAAAVVRNSAQYDLEPELVTAVLMVESNARPWVVSSKGAVGLMQVMPHMMRPLGLVGNVTTVESNIEAGCYILANNIRRLGEDRGISSYFWGNRIRGVAYLEKVRAAREELRRRRPS